MLIKLMIESRNNDRMKNWNLCLRFMPERRRSNTMLSVCSPTYDMAIWTILGSSLLRLGCLPAKKGSLKDEKVTKSWHPPIDKTWDGNGNDVWFFNKLLPLTEAWVFNLFNEKRNAIKEAFDSQHCWNNLGSKWQLLRLSDLRTWNSENAH